MTTGSVAYPQWGLSWGYDRYGNRLNQTKTAGSVYQGAVSVDLTTNRIQQTTGTTYAYDANGNMTNDNMNTITYDAENRATSATNQSSAGAYVYDGNGLRVEKCLPNCTNPPNYTVYAFSGSKVIAEYDNGASPTAPSREYIYGGETLLAKIDSSGTKYYHQDQLSNRLVTDSNGNTYGQMGHFPFGDPWYNSTNDKLYFTSYERDTESGNDYAMARYYVWRGGRFLSLDALSGSIDDPQSLNHYTYVRNFPVGLVDPTGMDGEDDCNDDESCLGDESGQERLFLAQLIDQLIQFMLSIVDHTVVVQVAPIDEATSDWSILGGDSFGSFSFGVFSLGPQGAIKKARNQARLLLSDADCAKFLKGIIAGINQQPVDQVNLDNFLSGFDSLSIVPTPSGDPGVGYPTDAHVDHVGQGWTVHVDVPDAPTLPSTLLHEDFHTILFGQYDQGLAHQIWQSTGANGPDPASFSAADASSYNGSAFRKNCKPKKN